MFHYIETEHRLGLLHISWTINIEILEIKQTFVSLDWDWPEVLVSYCWRGRVSNLVATNCRAGNLVVLLTQYQSALVSLSLEWLVYSRMTSAQLHHIRLADNNRSTTINKHGL